jgi:5'-phosphate synthase pdxT subunit
MKIGILALQGGYAAHAEMLSRMGISWIYVRNCAELAQVESLILPGGESSTTLRLLQQEGLFAAIQQAGLQGMPMFGTCAGAILLAKHVLSPKQLSLGLVDVTVQRNAYGRQLASRITFGATSLKQRPLEMVFIRAPRLVELGADVVKLAWLGDEPVCIQQGKIVLAAFHPELTTDNTLHQHFAELTRESTRGF